MLITKSNILLWESDEEIVQADNTKLLAGACYPQLLWSEKFLHSSWMILCRYNNTAELDNLLQLFGLYLKLHQLQLLNGVCKRLELTSVWRI